MTADHNDPNVPLEQLPPVDVNEVPEEGPQPDENWGKGEAQDEKDAGVPPKEAPQDGE
jgi:hypothetical protein